MTTITEKEQATFDFENGRGPVPAHRHINRDKSIGGWVANTAQVSGDAQVSGNAQVSGSAWVAGSAQIISRRQIWTISPVGSEEGILTIVFERDKISCGRGCFWGTIDEFQPP